MYIKIIEADDAQELEKSVNHYTGNLIYEHKWAVLEVDIRILGKKPTHPTAKQGYNYVAIVKYDHKSNQ